MMLAVLQARMSSSRLPGKVLKPLAGRPMVMRQIERLARARRIDRLVLATRTEASDDPLAEVMAAAVDDALYPGNPTFTSADIRAFLATRPDLAQFGGHRRL